ncbi:MAG TPA: ABC transporter permease [Longimicrobiaceae bacterium]|nr:ABC transporter permease [Longimicrobiaceae bacterium]
MNFVAAREGVQIAIDALRSNKARALLTILGVVIGVATVMAMAAVIVGIRSTITSNIASMGPKNFAVERFDFTQVRFVNDGSQRPPWQGKPPITMREAEMLRELPSVQSVIPSMGGSADIRAGSNTVTGVSVRGSGFEWPAYQQGDFLIGRNFLPVEAQHSAPVVVLSDGLAEALFPGLNAVGKRVRIAGNEFTVSGVYKDKPNLFSSAAPRWAIVPANSAFKYLDLNPDWMELLVVPTASATQGDAMDEVTTALRTSRSLRPADDNNFALVRQEALLDLFNKITGTFFIVMLVLSSIGLMVGGVGVVAIMMISVTERTREIGVRKALGATRKEILWQFLIEAMTVTVIGGALGMLIGGGGALLLSMLTPIPASVPLWAVVAALGVSAVTGIGFGMYPANKAARLDPVEALRYE